MRRAVIVILGVALIAAVLCVGSSRGFPSTHWAVHGFFHDTLGLSKIDADRAAAVTRKTFHVPAYGLLALLVWFALPTLRRKRLVVLGIVLAVAISDEMLQSLQPNRSSSVRDVGVDLFGALLGIWVARWWQGRRARARARVMDQEGV